MPDTVDDPREVLAVLNSLGFVGITAKQLQAFMKDLKLHRKIKERERQQWREETQKKIFLKQQQSLLNLINNEYDENSSPNVAPEESVVKIRIKCVPESEENLKQTKKFVRVCQRKESPSPRRREHKNVNDSSMKSRKANTVVVEEPKNVAKSKQTKVELINTIPQRTASAPELSEQQPRRARSKSASSDPTGRTKERRRNVSRSSSRSRSKSFIRPWKLHPEVQRPVQNVKSDPVMLYQKYQKEWKQVSFPGENRHAKVRWAVREKMLGTDPTPRPILKISCSSASIRRG